MKFDAGWDDDNASDGGNLPLLPDGTHTGEITEAREKRLKFMEGDKNPDGLALVLTIDVSKYQQVQAIVPANYRGKIEAIARAAGVAIPVRGQEWDEQQLVGRTVTVETVLAVSKKGTEYVRVERWLPSPSKPLPAEVAKRQPPARSQSQKAHREFTANAQTPDDIPF